MRLYCDHSFVPSFPCTLPIINSIDRQTNYQVIVGHPHESFPVCANSLHVANLLLEIVQLLLRIGVLLCHLLEFLLPLITVLLESLDFAFEVTSLDISLTKPRTIRKE